MCNCRTQLAGMSKCFSFDISSALLSASKSSGNTRSTRCSAGSPGNKCSQSFVFAKFHFICEISVIGSWRLIYIWSLYIIQLNKQKLCNIHSSWKCSRHFRSPDSLDHPMWKRIRLTVQWKTLWIQYWDLQSWKAV